MNRSLLVLRPEPGNSQTRARAEAMGIEAIGVPLFEIAPVAWSAEPAAHYAGLLLTSANAVRSAGSLAAYRELPVYAVGTATAAAANEVGFASIVEGDSDVDRLIAKVATLGKHRLLHLSGEDATPFDARGIEIDRRIVYRAVELPAPAGLEDALSRQPVALLHSPRAARRFAELVGDKNVIRVVVISEAVARAAGPRWREVAVAAHPRDDAMLELAAKLCRKDRTEDR